MKVNKNSPNLWWHHKKLAKRLNIDEQSFALNQSDEGVEFFPFVPDLVVDEQVLAEVLDSMPHSEEDEREEKLARQILKALKKLKNDPDFLDLFKK